jgi:DHA2 family multidrug resistance protein
MAEAIIGSVAFYLFVVHMFSSRRPFLNSAIFKDRNFVASNVFIFVIGAVLFATLALLPPMLQNQLQYPVILAGLVTMPRGLGTISGMILVGRLIKRFDPRAIMAAGLVLTAYSLWRMTGFSLGMGSWPVIISGIIQGLGVALVYVPLSMVAFATLPGGLRNEGTSFFNLLRNVGSSVGISVVTFMLTQNTQRVHASLTEHITPFNMAGNPAAAHVDVTSTSSLLALNAMMTNQSAMIGYIDDFKLMMVLTIATIPFLLMIRNVKPAPGSTSVVAE